MSAATKTLRPAHEDILLFAKYHYGQWNCSVMCARLITIVGRALLVNLNSSTSADGLPLSRYTREALMTMVVRAVEHYYGECAHEKIAKVFAEHAPREDVYLNSLGGLVHLLTTIPVLDDGIPMFTFPEIDPELTALLNPHMPDIGPLKDSVPGTDHAA